MHRGLLSGSLARCSAPREGFRGVPCRDPPSLTRRAGPGNAFPGPTGSWRGEAAAGQRRAVVRQSGFMSSPADLTYGAYLRLDDLLACQSPLTEQHDELLFVIIHQVYELWFKQILHEAERLQATLEAADAAAALATARRIAKILKTMVGQMDVLETMTPRQFASFRPELGSSSGFQSAQFRYLEAVLGRRDFSRAVIDQKLAAIMARPPVYASLLRFLAAGGWDVPAAALGRDPREPGRPRRRGAGAARRRLRPVRRARRGLRGAGRHRRGRAGVALPPREDGRADHRRQDGHRRLGRLGLPARHVVPPRLPRPVGDPLPPVTVIAQQAAA